jgi:hypothetical protein
MDMTFLFNPVLQTCRMVAELTKSHEELEMPQCQNGRM